MIKENSSFSKEDKEFDIVINNDKCLTINIGSISYKCKWEWETDSDKWYYTHIYLTEFAQHPDEYISRDPYQIPEVKIYPWMHYSEDKSYDDSNTVLITNDYTGKDYIIKNAVIEDFKEIIKKKEYELVKAFAKEFSLEKKD